MNKKGVELNALPAIGVLLVLCAFLIAVGSDVEDNVRQNIIQDTSYTVLGESFTALNASGDTLDKTPMVSGSLRVYNSSNLVEIGVNNFTVTYETGLLVLNNKALAQYNNTPMKANYTYTDDLQDYNFNVSTSSLEGTKKLSEWQDTIGLVVGAAVIIGLILAAFKFSNGF